MKWARSYRGGDSGLHWSTAAGIAEAGYQCSVALGFYIGGNVGYGLLNQSCSETAVNSFGTAVDSGTNNRSGPISPIAGRHLQS